MVNIDKFIISLKVRGRKNSVFCCWLIKTLLGKTNNNFWVDVLKSWLYVLALYIGNLQNSDKVTLSPVWYTSKIKKGVKSGNDFLDDN